MDQQSSKCAHYFIVDSPRESWSLAICRKCNKIDAFLNWKPLSQNTIRVTISKREFLRSKGIKYWETYSDETKNEVIQAVPKLGIHKAAKKFGIPISTVGLWAKGRSRYVKNSAKYPSTFKASALRYYKKEQNFKKVARKLGVPRSTLQSWARKAFKRSY